DADFDSKTAPRILSPQINFLMNSLLRDVVQKGTAVDAKILGRQDLAGKTGTTNDFRDAWFNGYTSGISASAWVGRDNYRSLGNRETGGKTALPMWIEFMKVALKNTPETPLSVPPGITEAYIDPGTGLLAASGSKNGILEYFQEGSAPSRDASAADEYSTGHSPGLGGNLETLGKAVEKPVEALF
ncbi:MAG: peptidase, partial [Gammaproteobacteria bacterium]